MGYIRDHAIIVVGTYGDYLADAHAEAARIFDAHSGDGGIAPSAITPPAVNGSQSFFIPPDGSKEGWGSSEDGDARRDKFISYLESVKYEDGSSPLKWVEVRVSDDDEELTIERSYCAPRAEVTP